MYRSCNINDLFFRFKHDNFFSLKLIKPQPLKTLKINTHTVINATSYGISNYKTAGIILSRIRIITPTMTSIEVLPFYSCLIVNLMN